MNYFWAKNGEILYSSLGDRAFFVKFLGSKIGFSDLSMGSWGRRPSFLALLITNRGRGIDWCRFYLNRSRSWKFDFLTPPAPQGWCFRIFFSRFRDQGPISYRFYRTQKNPWPLTRHPWTKGWFLQRPCLKHKPKTKPRLKHKTKPKNVPLSESCVKFLINTSSIS